MRHQAPPGGTLPLDSSVCQDRVVKVDTPIGDYPFEFRRIERRGDGMAIVGLIAGLKSDLVLDRDEVLVAGGVFLAVLTVGAALGYRRRASR
jgi:hypothetical protein